MRQRTKIICTLGPASQDISTLEKMISAGMDIARLAFSHGSYAHHALLIKHLRQAAKKTGKPVAIMQDLQGPRFRIGTLKNTEALLLEDGEHVILVSQSLYDRLPRTAKQKKPSEKILPLNTATIFPRVQRGQDILINDGLILLMVEQTRGEKIYAKVHRGGRVENHKGINIPHLKNKTVSLTEKDKRDIVFGIKHDVDFITLSFIKDGRDIITLQKFLSLHEKRGQQKIKIIAKIECVEAVENFYNIIQAADGIMIARGDLGLELATREEVPVVQKQLARAALAASKPVIVATQMLESMMERPLPSRAETSDIANAVIDHCDATMLSNETSLGKYPVECVRRMRSTLVKTERSIFDDFDFTEHAFHTLPPPIFPQLQMLSASMHTPVILIGNTMEPVRILTSLRMERRLILVCNDVKIARQCTLYWGGEAYLVTSLKGLRPNLLLASLRKEKVLPKHGQVLMLNEQYVQIYP